MIDRPYVEQICSSEYGSTDRGEGWCHVVFFFLKFTEEMFNNTFFFFFSLLEHTSDVSQIP